MYVNCFFFIVHGVRSKGSLLPRVARRSRSSSSDVSRNEMTRTRARKSSGSRSLVTKHRPFESRREQSRRPVMEWRLSCRFNRRRLRATSFSRRLFTLRFEIDRSSCRVASYLHVEPRSFQVYCYSLANFPTYLCFWVDSSSVRSSVLYTGALKINQNQDRKLDRWKTDRSIFLWIKKTETWPSFDYTFNKWIESDRTRPVKNGTDRIRYSLDSKCGRFLMSNIKMYMYSMKIEDKASALSSKHSVWCLQPFGVYKYG